MNNYDILGVSPNATKAEIKKAYHNLSMRYHPDMSGGDTGKFLQIKEAYDTLMLFRPNNTHNIYTQSRVESFVIIHHHYFDHKTGGLRIIASFSRNMLSAKVMGKYGARYSWILVGLNAGELELDESFLVECKFQFEIYFITNSGKTITKSFKFDDPRSKSRKFKSKYLTADFYSRIIGWTMFIIGVYYLVKSLIK